MNITISTGIFIILATKDIKDLQKIENRLTDTFSNANAIINNFGYNHSIHKNSNDILLFMQKARQDMLNQFSRTELLFGKEAMDYLFNAKVAVFGIGGVGGYVCEALIRSGVKSFDLIDDDKVCLTNLNRQIIATRKTIGKYKADMMKERIFPSGKCGPVPVS